MASAFVEPRSLSNGRRSYRVKYRLGGRDINPDHIKQAFDEVKEVASSGKSSDETGFLGVRE